MQGSVCNTISNWSIRHMLQMCWRICDDINVEKLDIRLSFAKCPPLPTTVPADKWFSQDHHIGATYPLPSTQTEMLPASTTGPQKNYTTLNSLFHSMVDQAVPQVTAEKYSNNVITPNQGTSTTDTNQQQPQ